MSDYEGITSERCKFCIQFETNLSDRWLAQRVSTIQFVQSFRSLLFLRLPMTGFRSLTESAVPFEPVSASPCHEIDLRTALDLLRCGDFQMRWDIAKLLPSFGTAAVAPLLDLLQPDNLDAEADWELLWFAARVLGDLNQPAAIVSLAHLLKTTHNETVAGTAASALANLGVPAVPALTELLAPGDTRLLAVQALGQIESPVVIDPLLSVVRSPSPLVRATAIEALSRFQTPAVVSVLLEALQDPFASVRQAAIVGLRVSPVPLQPDVVEHLKPLLYDLNVDVCCQAAIVLGHFPTSASTHALSNLLQSPQTPLTLQTVTVQALGWMATVAALEALQLHLIQEPLTSLALPIYQEIIAVLGRVEATDLKPQAATILLHLLQSDHLAVQDTQTRQAIAFSLGQLGQPEAMDPLTQLLTDPDPGVQLHATSALRLLNLS